MAMPDKIISASALREQLGIDPDGDCEKCRFRGMFGCRQSGDFVRACTAIDDCPAVDTLPAGWVSVSERLPTESSTGRNTYLVYAPTYRGGSSSGKEGCGGVMFSKWTGKHWSIEVGYYSRPNCVTHWMPLPEPPKEVNDGN